MEKHYQFGTARETIMERLRANPVRGFDMPNVETLNPITFQLPINEFMQKVVEVGGQAECVDCEQIAETVLRYYPQAKRIASTLTELSCVNDNPDKYEEPADLYGVDVAIVKGQWGIAENGAVWVSKQVKHKALYFVTEALVILLPIQNIVCNMHEIYAHPDFNNYTYGSFISGPSKTADIEQALVLGAQAAQSLLVLVVNE